MRMRLKVSLGDLPVSFLGYAGRTDGRFAVVVNRQTLMSIRDADEIRCKDREVQRWIVQYDV